MSEINKDFCRKVYMRNILKGFLTRCHRMKYGKGGLYAARLLDKFDEELSRLHEANVRLDIENRTLRRTFGMDADADLSNPTHTQRAS